MSTTMIDATQHHDPAKAAGLVASAMQAAGSQRVLAERCGISSEYLRQLGKGRASMSYALQVTLEAIIRGS